MMSKNLFKCSGKNRVTRKERIERMVKTRNLKYRNKNLIKRTLHLKY